MVLFYSYKVVIFAIQLLIVFSSAHLRHNYYDTSCPLLHQAVQEVLEDESNKDARMGASLLRLHFHDCFVHGCDGSILLDDPFGEQNAHPNINSLRGYDVIDRIKYNVEKICPGKVSCADIVALAARQSVMNLGGPSWDLLLGRLDGVISSQNDANNDLPSPDSDLKTLLGKFTNVGLNERDLVALSGAHTIGKSHCSSFKARLYHDRDINPRFLTTAKSNCFSAGTWVDQNLESLDALTPMVFDNNYYKDLVVMRGLLHSDQQLLSGGPAGTLVRRYSKNQTAFFDDFASAMTKMSGISPLIGKPGEVRTNCSRRNNHK